MAETYYEDFDPGTTHELGEHTFMRDEIVEFARQYDPQPFHVSEEAASTSHFGGLVASGWHTVCVCTRLVIENLYGDGGSNGSPGIEELRWPTPVRPGDTLTARAEILSKRPLESNPDLGLVKIRKRMVNQDGDEALSMDVAVFFARRDSDAH